MLAKGVRLFVSLSNGRDREIGKESTDNVKC